MYYNYIMMIRVTKQIAIMIALVTCISLLGCAQKGDTIASSAGGSTQSTTIPVTTLPDIKHDDVTLADMKYERPDIEGMDAALSDLQDGIKQGKDAQEMIASYKEIQAQYSHADSMLSLAYLLYAFDVTNDSYTQEYSYLQSALSELDAKMETVSVDLFASSDEARQLARESFGEGYVDAIMGDELFDDRSIQDLLDQEEQLTLDYNDLSTTFTLLDNGTRWTYGDILGDTTLSNDEYHRLYDAYCAALNQKAGAIFLQQIPIRIEIAKRLGYADYVSYCYDTYGRDYTPKDARTLHAAVKQYIAPLFVKARKTVDANDLSSATFDEDAFFSALSSSANAFSPLLSEPVTFLLRNRLYDCSVSDVKMDSKFTTYISDYRAPFIFASWHGTSDDVASILHELGHFTNYYHNATVGYSAGDNLDLAEVDAQALVLLLFDAYEAFYGDLAQEARAATLIDAMYSLLSGCMEDEFQQDIYENPTMTLEQMNELYAKLADEYGLNEVYGYQGTEWVLISHTFQTPMYYISYAASMVPALELFDLAQENPEAAKAAYFNIVTRKPYQSLGAVLSQNGLNPVFSEATIQQIAKILKAYLS